MLTCSIPTLSWSLTSLKAFLEIKSNKSIEIKIIIIGAGIAESIMAFQLKKVFCNRFETGSLPF